MRILVCGSRHWTENQPIETALAEYKGQDITVITGGAKGADTIAHNIAKKLGYKTMVFNADWGRYGRAAGPIRNAKMLSDGKPDLILAFHNDLSASLGTKNMINQAQREKIPVKLCKL